MAKNQYAHITFDDNGRPLFNGERYDKYNRGAVKEELARYEKAIDEIENPQSLLNIRNERNEYREFLKMSKLYNVRNDHFVNVAYFSLSIHRQFGTEIPKNIKDSMSYYDYNKSMLVLAGAKAIVKRIAAEVKYNGSYMGLQRNAVHDLLKHALEHYKALLKKYIETRNHLFSQGVSNV